MLDLDETASATRPAPVFGVPWLCEPASQRECFLRPPEPTPVAHLLGQGNRAVTVASPGHQIGPTDYDDVQMRLDLDNVSGALSTVTTC